MTAPLLIQLDQQQLGYDQHTVLEMERLSIGVGEKVALLGISGSGKSTLLNFLYRQLSEQVAYCPQQLGLVAPLSVFHNIYMGRLHQRSGFYNLTSLIKPRAVDINEISELAEVVKLREKLFTSVDQLSGGQQQRTALARAFYAGADVFVGDEPVSAVDELQSATLLDEINRRHQTAIVALHDRDLALSHFDRIIGLKRGRILLDAPASQLTRADLADIYSA